MISQDVAIEPDIHPDAETSYKALRRAIQRGVGFSLLFVRCTPVKGIEIVERIQADLPQKRIEVLSLDANTENLYHLVENLTEEKNIEKQSFDVLFIRGLEESLFQYEDREQLGILGRSKGTGYGGNWESVPRILGHLNLSRERFRDNFKLCFVFLLPDFALNYFIRRAPDFFDWRSNVYEFPTEKELVSQESYRLADGSYQGYCEQLPEHRIAKLAKIKAYLEEGTDFEERSSLWFEKGLIHAAANEHQEEINSYDKALQIKPGFHQAWNSRGIALFDLGRNEEAIASYDKALQIKPDDHKAWYNRGNALFNLGRYEEAIASYDEALQIKPDDHKAWYNRGIALRKLGRNEEAISSYDEALQIKPDDHEAWYIRGIALRKLGRNEEAISSYDEALQIKPDDHEAWNIRGIALVNLGRNEEAISSFDRALAIKPDLHEAWYNRGNALVNLGRNGEAIASYDKALQFKPDKDEAWYNRGNALFNLGRNGEAISSYDEALQFKPDFHEAWYNRGLTLFNLGRNEEAIASYDEALQFKPDKHEAWYSRGIALGNLGRNEDAIESYEKALKLTDEINKKVEIIQAISNLYNKLGKFRESLAATQRINEIAQDMNIPVSEIFIHPQWLKKLLKFGESGKMKGFILDGLVIIFVPIWVPVAICTLIFRMVSQLAIKRKR
jgi:tetratricopeptide (TPR) repeat protein